MIELESGDMSCESAVHTPTALQFDQLAFTITP